MSLPRGQSKKISQGVSMKRVIFIVALAIFAVAPVFYIAYNAKYSGVENSKPILEAKPEPEVKSFPEIQFQKVSQELKPGAQLNVLACKVIDGYRFGLILEGDNLIEAHLPVATKESATTTVVEWLNEVNSVPPIVTLIRKVDNYWIVRLVLIKNGSKIDMVDALQSKGLLLK